MSRVALVEYFIHSPGVNVDQNDKESLLQKKKIIISVYVK